MAKLSFGRMGIRKDNVAPALGNTCQWLFTKHEYQDWRNLDLMRSHNGFMWIKSKPGAGKSTLMKFLLEAASERFPDDEVISFFFNARGDVEERSLTGLYRESLHQLLSAVPRLKTMRIAADIDRLKSDTTKVWQLSSLRAVLRRLILDPRSEQLTCLIDAFDETSKQEIRELIEFFEDLGSITLAKGIAFRVCLSSRHYPHVDLDKCRYLNLDDQHDHRRDIALYVKQKLKLHTGKIADDILESIQERAQGIVLWAVLVTQILRKDCQRGNVHKVRDRLDTIPDGLHNLFHEIIHRVADDEDDEKILFPIRSPQARTRQFAPRIRTRRPEALLLAMDDEERSGREEVTASFHSCHTLSII